MRELFITAALAAAPLLALGASAGAARNLPRRLARPWWLLAASALVAALAMGLLGLDLAPTTSLAQVSLQVASLGLFATALGWILLLRDRQRFLEIALDASLIVAAVTVATLSWSPGARLLGPAAASSAAPAVGIFGAPITATCAVLFALALLLVRGNAPGVAPFLFATGAITLAASIAPLGLGRDACCNDLSFPSLAFAAGWSALALTALYAARRGARGLHLSSPDAGGIRLRLVVAPTVALIMGAVAVDAAWSGELQQTTGIALGVLGMVLGMRVTQLFAATRSLSEQRAELHQTRALVELSHALSGIGNLQETLDMVTRWAVDLLDGKGAAIVLTAPDEANLEFRSIFGLPDELLKVSLPIDGSFAGWIVRNSRPRATRDARTEPYMHATGVRYIGSSPAVGAPLRYRNHTLGALLCTGHHAFDDGQIELLGALADQAAVAIENARLFDEVHRLSLTDPLTGLPNRRQLEQDLTREFAAARRGRRLVAIMFDLNNFKQYNDRHGHLAGDAALQLFAEALSAEMRTMNTAARYGGDEFIALLADADRAGAGIFLERVRARFPGPNVTGRERELSVSAGLAEFNAGMKSVYDLIAAADAALYGEKLQRAPARQLSAG